MKKASLKSNSTQEFSVPKFIKYSIYLKISSNHNITKSKNLTSTESEAQVAIPNIPPIDYKWKVFARKHGRCIFINQHYRSAKHTLKRNVHKLNGMFFRLMLF